MSSWAHKILLKSRFCALLVTLSLSLGAGAEPALKASILTFDGSGFWEAIRTSLKVSSDGLYQTEKIEPLFTAGNCENILQSFQRRPLEVMRENGYIDSSTYQKLMDFQKLGIRPPQLTLISLYSDLTATEVKEYFPNGLPPERALNGDVRTPQLKRVNRGALYIVRGYELLGTKGKRPEVSARPLPWELDSHLPNGLTRRFDRKKNPYIVEIGRAHAEGKPLPGNFKTAAHLATAILAHDAEVLGITLQEMLITGHFLDAQHTRFFTKAFPLRPLNDQLMTTIEAAGGLNPTYLQDIELPKKREEWDRYADTVTIGTLERFLETFPIEQISSTAHSLMTYAKSKVTLTGLQAQSLLHEYTTNMREHFAFHLEGIPDSPAPLTVYDYGTPFLGYRMLQTFLRRGFPYDPHLLNGSLAQVQNLQRSPTPDLFMDRWLEKVHPLPTNSKGLLRAGWIVTNLDPKMTETPGIGGLYPAAVLLSLAAKVDHQIQSFSPERFKDFMDTINDNRAAKGRPQSSDISAVEFLDFFPIFIHTENAKLAALLGELGGKPEPTNAMALKFVSGPATSANISMEMRQSTMFKFDGKAIRQLRSLYHVLDHQAASRLRPSIHNSRLRLLQSGAF
ncbi:MAG: hypothetical protein AB7F86_14725 [Bdellovibrionales bacterium]